MAWTAPRTWETAELVTADLMNIHLRNQLLYLKGIVIASGEAGTDFAVTAGAGTFEDDTTLDVSITPAFESTVIVFASGVFSADTANDTSAKFGVILDSTTLAPTNRPYIGASNVDNREQFAVLAIFTDVNASAHTLEIQVARQNAGEAVTVRNRMIVAIAIPE